MLAARQPSGPALLRRDSPAWGGLLPAAVRPPLAMLPPLKHSRMASIVRAGLGSYLQRHTLQLR